jgi:hypothetical protein
MFAQWPSCFGLLPYCSEFCNITAIRLVVLLVTLMPQILIKQLREDPANRLGGLLPSRWGRLLVHGGF